MSEGSKVSSSYGKEKVLPTVFKWEGGGKNVLISGTFSNWKALPMVKRYAAFIWNVEIVKISVNNYREV